MKTFILILSFFSSISAFGAYYISIGDNDNLNNSIVSTGGGNNYYNKSLNELVSDSSYSADPLLKGFVDILKKYQQNQLTQQGHVDAFRQIKANTPYANISLKVSIFDGTNGIIFLDVISGTKRFQTFTPMSIQNGEWTINGTLLKNSNIIGIFTTLLNYGRQITPAEFEKYKNFLKTLPLDISYPVFTKITHDTAKIPAFVITYYTQKGETVKKASEYLKNCIIAYNSKDSSFYSYWAKEERETLEKMNNANNRLLTLESPILSQIEKCNKDGYSILGISEIGTIIILYTVTDNGDFFPFFLRKYSSGELKFVASSLYGGCSMYMISFFTSPEFKDAFMTSSSLFSNSVKDITSVINSFLMQREK